MTLLALIAFINMYECVCMYVLEESEVKLSATNGDHIESVRLHSNVKNFVIIYKSAK